jgi:hypothetical protein
MSAAGVAWGRAVVLALIALGLVACLGVTVASGERSQQGTLISSLDGGVSPLTLPRDRPAPVTLHLSGGLQTEDGSLLPKVARLELAVAAGGSVDTTGLPLCSRGALLNTRPGEALAACAPALVGRGRVDAVVVIPGQPPSDISARLLAFNGRTRAGERAVLVQAYAARPPISVVIPFAVRHRSGRFPTALVANLPRALGPLPRFAGVDIELGRRYTYRGERHSYLSSSCPAPTRFTAGFLAIAKATYTLQNGRRLSTEIVRSCRAR